MSSSPWTLQLRTFSEHSEALRGDTRESTSTATASATPPPCARPQDQPTHDRSRGTSRSRRNSAASEGASTSEPSYHHHHHPPRPPSSARENGDSIIIPAGASASPLLSLPHHAHENYQQGHTHHRKKKKCLEQQGLQRVEDDEDQEEEVYLVPTRKRESHSATVTPHLKHLSSAHLAHAGGTTNNTTNKSNRNGSTVIHRTFSMSTDAVSTCGMTSVSAQSLPIYLPNASDYIPSHQFALAPLVGTLSGNTTAATTTVTSRDATPPSMQTAMKPLTTQECNVREEHDTGTDVFLRKEEKKSKKEVVSPIKTLCHRHQHQRTSTHAESTAGKHESVQEVSGAAATELSTVESMVSVSAQVLRDLINRVALLEKAEAARAAECVELRTHVAYMQSVLVKAKTSSGGGGAADTAAPAGWAAMNNGWSANLADSAQQQQQLEQESTSTWLDTPARCISILTSPSCNEIFDASGGGGRGEGSGSGGSTACTRSSITNATTLTTLYSTPSNSVRMAAQSTNEAVKREEEKEAVAKSTSFRIKQQRQQDDKDGTPHSVHSISGTAFTMAPAACELYTPSSADIMTTAEARRAVETDKCTLVAAVAEDNTSSAAAAAAAAAPSPLLSPPRTLPTDAAAVDAAAVAAVPTLLSPTTNNFYNIVPRRRSFSYCGSMTIEAVSKTLTQELARQLLTLRKTQKAVRDLRRGVRHEASARRALERATASRVKTLAIAVKTVLSGPEEWLLHHNERRHIELSSNSSDPAHVDSLKQANTHEERDSMGDDNNHYKNRNSCRTSGSSPPVVPSTTVKSHYCCAPCPADISSAGAGAGASADAGALLPSSFEGVQQQFEALLAHSPPAPRRRTSSLDVPALSLEALCTHGGDASVRDRAAEEAEEGEEESEYSSEETVYSEDEGDVSDAFDASCSPTTRFKNTHQLYQQRKRDHLAAAALAAMATATFSKSAMLTANDNTSGAAWSETAATTTTHVTAVSSVNGSGVQDSCHAEVDQNQAVATAAVGMERGTRSGGSAYSGGSGEGEVESSSTRISTEVRKANSQTTSSSSGTRHHRRLSLSSTTSQFATSVDHVSQPSATPAQLSSSLPPLYTARESTPPAYSILKPPPASTSPATARAPRTISSLTQSSHPPSHHREETHHHAHTDKRRGHRHHSPSLEVMESSSSLSPFFMAAVALPKAMEEEEDGAVKVSTCHVRSRSTTMSRHSTKNATPSSSSTSHPLAACSYTGQRYSVPATSQQQLPAGHLPAASAVALSPSPLIVAPPHSHAPLPIPTHAQATTMPLPTLDPKDDALMTIPPAPGSSGSSSIHNAHSVPSTALSSFPNGKLRSLSSSSSASQRSQSPPYSKDTLRHAAIAVNAAATTSSSGSNHKHVGSGGGVDAGGACYTSSPNVSASPLSRDMSLECVLAAVSVDSSFHQQHHCCLDSACAANNQSCHRGFSTATTSPMSLQGLPSAKETVARHKSPDLLVNVLSTSTHQQQQHPLSLPCTFEFPDSSIASTNISDARAVSGNVSSASVAMVVAVPSSIERLGPISGANSTSLDTLDTQNVKSTHTTVALAAAAAAAAAAAESFSPPITLDTQPTDNDESQTLSIDGEMPEFTLFRSFHRLLHHQQQEQAHQEPEQQQQCLHQSARAGSPNWGTFGSHRSSYRHLSGADDQDAMKVPINSVLQHSDQHEEGAEATDEVCDDVAEDKGSQQRRRYRRHSRGR